MSNFFTHFFQALASFIININFDNPSTWLFPLGTLVLCWFLTILILQQRKTDSLSRYTHIQGAFVLAGSITAAGVIGLACCYWAKNYYNDTPLEASHILCLLITFFISFSTLYTLSNSFSNKAQNNIVHQAYTYEERTRYRRLANKTYNRYRLLAIGIPLLGFLTLLLIITKPASLVAFVLDNTTSMGAPNGNGMVVMEVAKQTLETTIKELDHKTDIIISRFGEPTKKEIPEILLIRNYNNFLVAPVFFKNDKEGAIQYVNDTQAEVSSTSVCENVWKTYLYTKAKTKSEEYTSKIMVIITDGGESVSNYSGFFCDNTEFNDFYNGNIAVVKLLDGTNAFMDKMANCSYDVEDGNNQASFEDAIKNITNKYKQNSFFIFWLLAIYILYAILCLFTNPRN